MAQLAEQLICNQQVNGSSPFIGLWWQHHMDGFPSGQRGQTVNLLQIASVVRIPRASFFYEIREREEKELFYWENLYQL